MGVRGYGKGHVTVTPGQTTGRAGDPEGGQPDDRALH